MQMTVQSTMKFLLRNRSSGQRISPLSNRTAAHKPGVVLYKYLGTYLLIVYLTMQYLLKIIPAKMTLTFPELMAIMQVAKSMGTMTVTLHNQSVG